MRVLGAGLLLLLLIAVAGYAVGARLVLLPPDATRPDGATVLTTAVPEMRIMDSPAAFCALSGAEDQVRCVLDVTTAATGQAGLVLEMRYLPALESFVGHPQQRVDDRREV